MAISRLDTPQHFTTTGGAASPTTVIASSGYSYPAGSDRMALLAVYAENGTVTLNATAVTEATGSAAWTLVKRFSNTSLNDAVWLYRLMEADIPATTGGISVTHSNLPNDWSVYIWTMGGVDQTTPVVDNDNTDTQGSSTSDDVVVDTSADGAAYCILLNTANSNEDFNFSAGTEVASAANGNSGARDYIGELLPTSAGTGTLTFTQSGSSIYRAMGVSFAASSGGVGKVVNGGLVR